MTPRLLSAALLAAAASVVGAADSIGPFDWTRRAFDPADPQAAAIARDGSVESAELLPGGSSERGTLLLTAWSGDNQAGGRSAGGNNLIAPPGGNWFVGPTTAWRIQEGTDADGSFSYYTKFQQDARLLFGFADADPDRLANAHGDGFALGNALPFDRVAVVLPWRWVQGGGSSYQTSSFAGNPAEAGVWALRAGAGLATAQADAANKLAELDGVLAEMPPHRIPALWKLQINDGGRWSLRVDIGGDGEVDLDVDSEQAGNRRSPFAAMSERSGLVISAQPAQGSGTGFVGRTVLPLAFAASASAPIALPVDRRPFIANVPRTSRVSPATIDGQLWRAGLGLVATGPTLPTAGLPATVLGGTRFYLDLPLSPAGATPVLLSQSGTPPTTRSASVDWLPTDLARGGTHAIRSGDSLLLALQDGCGAGEPMAIDADGDGVVDLTGRTGDLMPFRYAQPGVFTARALRGGILVASATVRVGDVTLPERIACQVGSTRIVDVDTGVLPGTAIVATAADPTDLAVSTAEVSGNRVRLNLRALRRGSPVLQIRLDSATGPIVAAKEIDEFTLEFVDAAGGVVNDETSLTRSTLRLRPFIPNLALDAEMFGSRSSFAGGTNAFRVFSDGGASSAGEAPMRTATDPASGEGIGEFSYEIRVPPGENKACYRVTPREGEHLEQAVGVGSPNNPTWARIRVTRTVLAEGETKELPITVVKASATAGRPGVSTTAGSSGDSPPTIIGNVLVDASRVGPHLGAIIDCSAFKVAPNRPDFTKPHFPGAYTVTIGGAFYEDAVLVNPNGCEPFTPPEGDIALGAGAAYGINGTRAFIPPGGIQVYRADKLKDVDVCRVPRTDPDGITSSTRSFFFDTFAKKGAVTWSNAGAIGTLDPADGLATTVTVTAPRTAQSVSLSMAIKDDGDPAQDLAQPLVVAVRFLDVYELRGVEALVDDALAGDAAGRARREIEFDPAASHRLKAKVRDVASQGRPTLEYRLIDEAGATVGAPETTTSTELSFQITTPGRFRIRVTNIGRPVETFTSDEFLFFTLRIENPSVVFNWDPAEVSNAELERLRAKGISLRDVVKTTVEALDKGADAASLLTNGFAAVKGKAIAHTSALQAELGRTENLIEFTRGLAGNLTTQRDAAIRALAEAVAAGDSAAEAAARTRLGDLTRLISATEAEITRLAGETATLRRGIDAGGTALRQIIEAAQRETSFAEMGTKLRGIATTGFLDAAGKVIGIAAMLNDIDNMVINGGIVEDAIKAKLEADERIAEYGALIDALRATPRLPAPRRGTLVVITEPGNVDFTIRGLGATFSTRDPAFEDFTQFQKGFQKGHFTRLEGSFENWDGASFTTGSDGRRELALEALGNIGRESVQVQRRALGTLPRSAQIESIGASEDELLARIQPFLETEKANLNIVKGIVGTGLEFIALILDALGVFAKVTVIAAFALAAVSLAFDFVKDKILEFIDALNETDLERDIRNQYPKE